MIPTWQVHTAAFVVACVAGWVTLGQKRWYGKRHQDLLPHLVNPVVLLVSCGILYSFLLHVLVLEPPAYHVPLIALLAAAALSIMSAVASQHARHRIIRMCGAIFLFLLPAAFLAGIAFAGADPTEAGAEPGQAAQPQGIAFLLLRIDAFFERATAGNVANVDKLIVGAFVLETIVIVSWYYSRGWILNLKDSPDSLLDETVLENTVLLGILGLSATATLFLMGANLESVALFSGVVLAAITISLRELLTNMVAGLLLSLDGTIRRGDVISVGDGYGIVRGVSMRCTSLSDRNEVTHMIPNADLINQVVTNWSLRGGVRLKLDVVVEEAQKVGQAKQILVATARENPRVLRDNEHAPRALVMGVDDRGVGLQLRFFINDPDQGVRNVIGQIYEAMLPRLAEKGIRVGVPRRRLHVLRAE